MSSVNRAIGGLLFIIAMTAFSGEKIAQQFDELSLEKIHDLPSRSVVSQSSLITFINSVLGDEKIQSNKSVNFFSLASIGMDGTPRNRIVALRELNRNGILFFTQKSSRKVYEFKKNRNVATNFWLPSLNAQINIKGTVAPIEDEENQHFWSTYPKSSQIRFLTYGPISGTEVESSFFLDNLLLSKVSEHEALDTIPRPSAYVGYRISIDEVEFYRMNSDVMSDSLRFMKDEEDWRVLRLAP